jgi:hypothetical protein
MAKKKLTAYDLLQLKGRRQLSEVFVNNAEEAAAAEEAGMEHHAHRTSLMTNRESAELYSGASL